MERKDALKIIEQLKEKRTLYYEMYNIEYTAWEKSREKTKHHSEMIEIIKEKSHEIERHIRNIAKAENVEDYLRDYGLLSGLGEIK